MQAVRERVLAALDRWWALEPDTTRQVGAQDVACSFLDLITRSSSYAALRAAVAALLEQDFSPDVREELLICAEHENQTCDRFEADCQRARELAALLNVDEDAAWKLLAQYRARDDEQPSTLEAH
jgi:hypothetical protein